MTPNSKRFLLFYLTLLTSTLACRAATRIIIPDTPTPTLTPTVTFTPTVTPSPTPSPTPTQLIYEASCANTVGQILKDATAEITEREERPVDGLDEDEVAFLVRYTVMDDDLETPLSFPVNEELEDEQADRATHAEIWGLYARLIPAEERNFVKGFSIFTDGFYNYLASVNQSDRNSRTWELNVDIFDAREKTTLTYTLLHEHGHLLTLNANQVEVSMPVFRNPGDEEIYNEEAAKCDQYFTGEGCSNTDAYLTTFFDLFWTSLYAEWLEIDSQESERVRRRQLDRFYETYQDQFLTDYAATSPPEDIAESFAFFILQPKPELTTISSEKVLFFYNYPELIQLRMEILENLCAEFAP